MIEIGTPEFRVVVDETLGGEIVHLGPDDGNALAHYEWPSPVSARASSSYDAGGALDWLSDYRGGWQLLFPNAGDACSVDGIPLPFHGEWSRTRVQVTSQTPRAITLTSGCRLPLVMERTIAIPVAETAVHITTRIRNLAAFDVAFVHGEHPALALQAGSRIFLPAAVVHVNSDSLGPLDDLLSGGQGRWPQVPTVDGFADLSIVPSIPTERLCYLPDLPEAWAVAIAGGTAVSMVWDRETLPHLWFWQEIGGLGFPWYGRSAITALEPASHWPAGGGLAGAVERGQASTLPPGGESTSWLRMRLSDWTGGSPLRVRPDGIIDYEELA